MKTPLFYLLLIVCFIAACNHQPMHYDTIIKGGIVYDGMGNEGVKADVAISGDTIAAIGDLNNATADTIIDASGMAVSPGFINTLSWASATLWSDGRSMSDLLQGITLEVFGEGESLGPRRPDDSTETTLSKFRGAIHLPDSVKLESFADYMNFLQRKGVSPNIASFVGAATIRAYVMGYDNAIPTNEQITQMRQQTDLAMQQGALGLGTSLIYPPGAYAGTNELVEMCKAVQSYNGLYTSHIRSEGYRFEQAVQEVIDIATQSGVRAEIHHLKAAGKDNWKKIPAILSKIDSARAAGLQITTNMYTYTAASTGLGACIPPKEMSGGIKVLVEKLKNENELRRIAALIEQPTTEWENFYQLAGADNILLADLDADTLSHLIGKRLSDAAKWFGLPPAQALLHIVRINQKDGIAVYFLMSEENIQKQIQVPYMTFVTDARSIAAEGSYLKQSSHPRAYGCFTRLLGKYVRDEKIISLPQALYRLSGLAAQKLNISKRGQIKTGYFADILVFNPQTITDKSTFEQPHQYSEGITHVWVNGKLTIKGGLHTGVMAGRWVKR